jgi:predicted transcriptional regulator
MATMTIRLADEEKRLIQTYAKLHNTSAANVLRNITLERIEDELDLAELRKAMASSDGTFVPFEELAAKYGM